jgi:hypothetical protein
MNAGLSRRVEALERRHRAPTRVPIGWRVPEADMAEARRILRELGVEPAADGPGPPLGRGSPGDAVSHPSASVMEA